MIEILKRVHETDVEDDILKDFDESSIDDKDCLDSDDEQEVNETNNLNDLFQNLINFYSQIYVSAS